MSATVFFVGGGSGGHLFPGLAVAEQLHAMTREPLTVKFISSDRAIDSNILTSAGVQFLASPAKPIIMRPRGLVRFLMSWGPSVRHARQQYRDAADKGQVRVVAMGGFVAAPCVQAARAENVKTTMVNLDAVPGKANRWIAPRVDRVFSSAAVPDAFLPRLKRSWINVPPIVRASTALRVSRAQACATLKLDASRGILMVTGGSQGLRSLNDFVVAFAQSPLAKTSLLANRWQILHQTGRGFDAQVADAYEKLGLEARVVPFTDQLGLWWAAADLAICTAGAGNVAEIWQTKVPALLLPYPHHRDQHQRYNATPLAAVGGVVVGVDRIDPTLTLESNGAALADLLQSPSRRHNMRAALETLGPANGAERIARVLLDDLENPD